MHRGRLAGLAFALVATLGFLAMGPTFVTPTSYAQFRLFGKPKGPEPQTKTNCVKCHLEAGRELTDAVHNFAHSVHDRAELSCHDCHGGNTEDDAVAHEHEFGFIGTKLSAHLVKCAECHDGPAETLAAGPHFWEHSTRLNTNYPLCVDCHGNHDVGAPPIEFSMSLVCSECHDGYAEEFPALAAVTDAHDAMWADIVKWRSKQKDKLVPAPEDLVDELADVRSSTAELIHPGTRPTDSEAKAVVEKIEGFRARLAETSATAKR